MMTTIQLSNAVKKRLDLMKVHSRETYNELLERILESCSPNKFDKESLIETIDVLSDPETMRNLKEAMSSEDFISLDDLKKELKV